MFESLRSHTHPLFSIARISNFDDDLLVGSVENPFMNPTVRRRCPYEEGEKGVVHNGGSSGNLVPIVRRVVRQLCSWAQHATSTTDHGVLPSGDQVHAVRV